MIYPMVPLQVILSDP